MTVATYEDLEHYGYREVEIGGRYYYVGRDGRGAALVGPARRGTGLMNSLRRRKRKRGPLPVQGETLTVQIDEEAVQKYERESSYGYGLLPENTKTVDFSKLSTYAPPPQEKPSMPRRVFTWCKEKFYDENWQKGMTNTAGNVLLWSFTAFALLVFAKGAWWVLSM